MKKIIGVIFFLISVITLKAQDDDRALLKQVAHDNQTAVDAIAMYPPETRKDIFEASKYPELIVRLNTMQKNTDESFKELLSPYSQQEQEKIYNITRFPGLISDITAPSGREKSREEIERIVNSYPEEVRADAMEEAMNNYNLLATIDQRNKMYQSQFETMLYSYPPETADALHNLIKQPEILSLLSDNMQLTVLIGDVYKKDPQHVLHKADSLNYVLTQNNTQETADWQKSMNDDPQAQQEYEQAAQEYAQDNGYQPEEYSTPLNPEVVSYNTYPYNWWYGYPSWYPYAYWDPYPYWYDWGFYYGPHHHAIFFGCPSFYFMNWYFYHPEHCYHYPHLSNHYYDYYYGHRGGIGHNPICRGVNDWRNHNNDIVNDEWDKNPRGREQMFKDYGKMEMDRADYNKKNPQHTLQQHEYLQANQNKYPTIKSVPASKQPEPKSYSKPETEPVARPHVKIPDSYKAPENETKNNPRPNSNTTHETNTPASATPKQRTPISNQVRNAEQYHQNTWQQMQQPQQQNYSPAPQHSSPAPQRSAPTQQRQGGGSPRSGGRK